MRLHIQVREGNEVVYKKGETMYKNQVEIRLDCARLRTAHCRAAYAAFSGLFVRDSWGLPSGVPIFAGLPEEWELARDRAKEAYQAAKAEESLLEEFLECVAAQEGVIFEMAKVPEEYCVPLPRVGVVGVER